MQPHSRTAWSLQVHREAEHHNLPAQPFTTTLCWRFCRSGRVEESHQEKKPHCSLQIDAGTRRSTRSTASAIATLKDLVAGLHEAQFHLPVMIHKTPSHLRRCLRRPVTHVHAHSIISEDAFHRHACFLGQHCPTRPIQTNPK